MDEEVPPPGLDHNQLFAIGLLAAMVDFLAWLRFVTLLDGPESLNALLAACFAGAIMCMVVSAVYFVLSYLKAMELRLLSLTKRSAGD
jgi:hypothetical protein